MLHLATQLLLSPIVIPQAINVTRRALHLPEATGPRSATLGAGPALNLLIIGDSSAAGVGVETQNQALAGQLAQNLAQDFTVSWHLHARTGATTRSTLRDLHPTPPQVQADVIVIALGVNDVTHAVPFPVWKRAQKRLLDHLSHNYAPQQIYLSGMPPLGDFPLLPNPLRWGLGRQAQRFDAFQRQGFAHHPHITYAATDLPLDPALMAEDGFHPGPEVYALWGKEMASRILSDWPRFQK